MAKSVLDSIQDALGLKASGELKTGTDIVSKALGTFGSGGNVFTQGVNALGSPLSYYEGLLGNRQEALTAAAPEISTLQGQYNTAARAVSEFSPRGGGRVAQSAELPFTKQSAIQDVINKQRPQAAQGVTQIGQILADLGLSQEQVATALGNLGLGEQGLSSSDWMNAANIRMGKAAQSNELLGGLGSAIGKLLPAVLGLL